MLSSEEQTVAVRPVRSSMASGLPARPPRKMGGRFVRMALVAETARESGQHFRIVGAVRAVAFHTAFTRVARDRIVLEDKRPGHVSMAGFAHLRSLLKVAYHPLVGGADSGQRGVLLLGGSARVDLMTVAADHPPLRNRMMEVVAKLAGFLGVAFAAEAGLVRLEQLPGLGRGGEERNFPSFLTRYEVGGLSFLLRRSPMDSVAAIATYLGARSEERRV